MSEGGIRVFLSYGHDEYAEVALAINEELERAGHEVWLDTPQLTPVSAAPMGRCFRTRLLGRVSARSRAVGA